MKLIIFYLSIFTSFSCIYRDKPIENIDLSWISYRNGKFDSNEIRIFSGKNSNIPIKAFYAEVNLNSSNLSVEVVSSDDKDLRESPSQFAKRLNACLVVNGGYFKMDEYPAKHVGLLKTRDKTISSPLISVLRKGKSYFTTRGTVGFNKNTVDIAWVSGKDSSLFSFNNSVKNKVDYPPANLDFDRGNLWDIESAVSAGPVLVQDNKIFVTKEEEVFFDSRIPGIHPRTAIGYTDDNKLIILVVDGRQPSSRGLYLEELAQVMVDLKCREALNLDGGGSSALVVNNQLINRPSGMLIEREVMSAIIVKCDEN